jgi:anti-sigma B factor antagonist
VRSESGTQSGSTGEDTSSEAFALAVTQQGDARVLSASGEIDIISAPDLRGALQAALTRGGLVVLDLSEVSFLGSSGLAALVEARELTKPGNSEFRLVCASRIVLRALEATGLRELFDIFEDLPAALRG